MRAARCCRSPRARSARRWAWGRYSGPWPRCWAQAPTRSTGRAHAPSRSSLLQTIEPESQALGVEFDIVRIDVEDARVGQARAPAPRLLQHDLHYALAQARRPRRTRSLFAQAAFGMRVDQAVQDLALRGYVANLAVMGDIHRRG